MPGAISHPRMLRSRLFRYLYILIKLILCQYFCGILPHLATSVLAMTAKVSIGNTLLADEYYTRGSLCLQSTSAFGIFLRARYVVCRLTHQCPLIKWEA